MTVIVYKKRFKMYNWVKRNKFRRGANCVRLNIWE